MTNQELQNNFRILLHSEGNIFDVYMKLKDIQKDYHSTPFYKSTKMTIYQAFEIYLRGIGQIDYLAKLFNSASVDDMNNTINIIAESLNFDNILNTMSAEDKELMYKVIPFLQK
jgi:hypothetical protein